MHAAAKAAYTVTPQTTISAAFGLFNSAEETSGTPMDFIDGDGVDHSGGATYAGGSHVAAEIDAWLDYQLYSNATISIWAAYAMTGDALDLMMDNMRHESQDVLGRRRPRQLQFLANPRPAIPVADGFPGRRPLLFQPPFTLHLDPLVIYPRRAYRPARDTGRVLPQA